jgi:ribosome maturation factor RimP
MQSADSSLTKLTRAVVEPMGFELVGVELFQRGGGGATLRVYIDHERGITLDDCAAVSHQLSGVLDVEDPLPGHYDLEVSSPGIDRPLVFPEHFERFVGSRVRIRLAEKLDGRRKLEGELRGYASGIVTLDADEHLWEIPLDGIESARLVSEFQDLAEPVSGNVD